MPPLPFVRSGGPGLVVRVVSSYNIFDRNTPRVIPTSYANSTFDNAYREYIGPALIVVLPIIAIIVSNCIIVLQIMYRKRQSLGSTIKRHETKVRNAHRMTAQVVCISIVTLISRALVAAKLIMYSNGGDVYIKCSLSCVYIFGFFVLFVCFNAGTNFVLYCYFGANFRKAFLKLFCGNCLCRSIQRVMTPGTHSTDGWDWAGLFVLIIMYLYCHVLQIHTNIFTK